MLLLTGIALLLIFMLWGSGLLIHRLFTRQHATAASFDHFWLGFCALIAVLQLWHFFLPVNGWLFLLVAVLAAFGLFTWLRQSKPTFTWWSLAYAALLLIPLWVLLNHTLFSTPSYDHGLYHLQTVKWFNQYAIVPGLGNLQHRLAFNSSQYLYAAFANTSVFSGYSYYVASVILVYMLLLQSLLAFRTWLHGNTISAVVIYRVLLIPIILWQAGFEPLAGYSADMTVFVLQAVVFGKLLEMMNMDQHSDKSPTLFRQILILAATGVTIKLSFAVFGLLTIALAFILGARTASKAHFFKQQIPAALAIFVLWILPWLARNAVLSGYLLYPSDRIRLNLPWSMPDYLVENLQDGITLWARTYSDQIPYTANLVWFKEWAERFVFEPRTAFLLAAIILVVSGFLLVKNPKKVKITSGYLWLLVALSLALLFWFLSAPTYRFSGALIWLWLLTVILITCDWLFLTYSTAVVWRASLIMLILLLLLLPANFSRNISPSRFLSVPPEQALAAQLVPQDPPEIRSTKSGLQVYIAPEEACWDLPLPCTTPNDFISKLQLIDPTNMGKGFRISESK